LNKCGELAPATQALAGWQVGGRHWPVQFHPLAGRQRRWETDKKQNGKARWRMVCLCGLPPIEQKTLDGWGTVSFPVGRQRRWETKKKLLSATGASRRFQMTTFEASFLPSLRDGGLLFQLRPRTASAAADLSWAIFLFSLRENGQWVFHLPWVGKAGGRLTQNRILQHAPGTCGLAQAATATAGTA